MANIYGSHFEYAGISSRFYGLILVNVNTSRMIQMSGATESVTLFNKKSKKKYLIDTDYTDSPITFDIEIISDNERCLELEERREIEKWLFNRREYRKLFFDSADDYYGETYEFIENTRKRSYLNCRFLNPEKLEYNGGVVGYKATIEADSNMFWQEATTEEFIISNGSSDSSSIITVNVDTDLDDYIYPKVKITMGEVGGDIIIANNRDDSERYTKFVGLSPYASIVMKGEINYVSGQYYNLFALRNFIRLLDGKNNLTVMGDVATIEFEYSARRLM